MTAHLEYVSKHMYTDFKPLKKWIEVARTGVNNINNELWLPIHSGGVNNEFNIALAVHFTQPMVYSRVGERIGVRVCSSRWGAFFYLLFQ